MSKQREDPYCVVGAFAPRCVVAGCAEPVVAQVHFSDRNRARETFHEGGHVYACEFHLSHDPRMRRVRWQELIPF